jgi:hypothetical protein
MNLRSSPESNPESPVILPLPRSLYTLRWCLNFMHAVVTDWIMKCHTYTHTHTHQYDMYSQRNVRGCLCDSRTCTWSPVTVYKTWWLNVSSSKFCPSDVVVGYIRIYLFVKKRRLATPSPRTFLLFFSCGLFSCFFSLGPCKEVVACSRFFYVYLILQILHSSVYI